MARQPRPPLRANCARIARPTNSLIVQSVAAACARTRSAKRHDSLTVNDIVGSGTASGPFNRRARWQIAIHLPSADAAVPHQLLRCDGEIPRLLPDLARVIHPRRHGGRVAHEPERYASFGHSTSAPRSRCAIAKIRSKLRVAFAWPRRGSVAGLSWTDAVDVAAAAAFSAGVPAGPADQRPNGQQPMRAADR